MGTLHAAGNVIIITVVAGGRPGVAQSDQQRAQRMVVYGEFQVGAAKPVRPYDQFTVPVARYLDAVSRPVMDSPVGCRIGQRIKGELCLI